MRVLFYGTPAFSLPTLEALIGDHQVVAVVTQPDRPAHRGQRLTASPVKERTRAAGIPLLQPARLRDPEWPERLREYGPEVGVVVAFGQILPRTVLDVPARGCLNVHASLLPRYRGAAPIAWAIIRGETETGISIMQMDESMDTGPVLCTSRTSIGPDETAADLASRLATMGAEALLDVLSRLDCLAPLPQAHAKATLAPRLKKNDGDIDWTRRARDLVNLVRGCNPWPGAYTRTPAGGLLIWKAGVLSEETAEAPGTLVAHGTSLAVATSKGALLPLEVQAEGRRVMPWNEYLRGARLAAGTTFGAR
ncbi:MAG: methionyl-tRNA formyltransferase [Candidatus Rokuibacteriota bacterium]